MSASDSKNHEIAIPAAMPAPETTAIVADNATITRTIFPTERAVDDDTPSVFLAGSIDMGEAIDWQAEITNSLQDLQLGINIFNPRRPHWDSTWKQDIDFKPFFDQVDWELDMLEKATVIAMYLPANSKAPISLLELGLFARGGTLIVGCPKDFWRRGNVEIVCKKYNVPMVDTLPELVSKVHARLAEFKAEREKSPKYLDQATSPLSDSKVAVVQPTPTVTKEDKDAKASTSKANDGKVTAVKQRRNFSISICRNQ
jgi:hypothetical protein